MTTRKPISPVRRRLLAAGLAAPIALHAGFARAAWPERPIKLIVPASPGGAADITARLIADGMGQALGVPVVIENRAGAGTNIGLGVTARAAPDGYTFGISTSAFVINPGLYDKLPFDPLTDFAYVCELTSAPGVLLVRSDSGITSVRELIARARADQSKFNISTPAIGTPPHLQAEVLKQRENLQNIATVVFSGGGEAVAALLGGQVQACSGVLATGHARVKSGALRALAVSGNKRWPDLPDVPTMLEAGMKDFEFDNYTALVAPAKTPADMLARVEKAALEAVQRADVAQKLLQGGSVVTATSGKEHAARVAREIPFYRNIIAQARIPRVNDR
jgi:tripartite-type tricarboxylate transporter receptor subunit TctC